MRGGSLHGFNRRAMGDSRTTDSEGSQWGPWASEKRITPDSRWNSVDFTHWSAMERSAGSISTIPNMPSPIPRVARSGRPGGHIPEISRGFTRPRENGFEREFHRRVIRRREKRGRGVGKTKRGKGTKIMVLANRTGLPVSVYVDSATPHEIRLVQQTIDARSVEAKPDCVIGDKAYDSDALDKDLETQGIEMIAPHRENRIKPPTQDGRRLRRYGRRWKVERLFAWLQNFRRLVVRYEYHVENFLAFAKLACIMILLRQYF